MIALERLIVNALQLSVAEAKPFALADVSAVHWIVTEAGQVMIGATVSITVIVWTQLRAFPHWSVAVQVLAML